VYDSGQSKPKLKACKDLAKTKFRVCHATALDKQFRPLPGADVRKGRPAETCKSTDTIAVLDAKLQAYINCNNWRLIESTSSCFAEADEGHVDAVISTDEFIEKCEAYRKARVRDMLTADALYQGTRRRKSARKSKRREYVLVIPKK
jgi:hypothetical protein